MRGGGKGARGMRGQALLCADVRFAPVFIGAGIGPHIATYNVGSRIGPAPICLGKSSLMVS